MKLREVSPTQATREDEEEVEEEEAVEKEEESQSETGKRKTIEACFGFLSHVWEEGQTGSAR